MRILIDSQGLIWYVDQDHLLPRLAYATITDPANELWISVATIWEISIKVGIGKLQLSAPYLPWIKKAIADLGAFVLDIKPEHADVQSRLPLHHRDPFDRMLIAQTQFEQMNIVSGDAAFDAYGVTRVW